LVPVRLLLLLLLLLLLCKRCREGSFIYLDRQPRNTNQFWHLLVLLLLLLLLLWVLLCLASSSHFLLLCLLAWLLLLLLLLLLGMVSVPVMPAAAVTTVPGVWLAVPRC
jgi:hypothetical protein